MDAERPVVRDQHVVEPGVVPNVVLGEDVVASVPPEFALTGNKGHPLELEVGVLFGRESLDVPEGPVECPHKVVPDLFAGGVGVEPLAVFPVVGRGDLHHPRLARIMTELEGGVVGVCRWTGPVFQARLDQLTAQICVVLRDLRRPGHIRERDGMVRHPRAEEERVAVVHVIGDVRRIGLVIFRSRLATEHRFRAG